MPLHRRSIFQNNYKDMYEAKQTKLLEEVERQMSQPTKPLKGGVKKNPGQITVYEGLMAAVASNNSDKGDNDDEDSKRSSQNVVEEKKPRVVASPRKRGMGMPDENEKQFESPPHTPIIIILDGKCKVVNPQDGYLVADLNRGDVVGDSDFLKYTVSHFFY